MSRSFFKNCLTYTKFIFEDNTKRELISGEIALRVGILATVLIGHGIYAYSTQEKDEIIVMKKYKMNKNGFTDFMIIDDKGRHFNVNNSLWYWKWDSIEDWHRIEENKKIFVKYYGWRMPILGLFPNIVLSDKSKFLDSITCSEFITLEAKKLI